MSRYLVQNSPERIEELKEFLWEAHSKAMGTNKPTYSSPEGTHRTIYERGGWRLEDEWYGAVPFSGFTKISFYGDVCWTMHYCGSFFAGFDHDKTCRHLIDLLLNPDPDSPWRGRPGNTNFEDGGHYYNESRGDITSFNGCEFIHNNKGIKIFRSEYRGGLVKY